MACGGCKGGGNRHSNNGNLKKFAFLNSRQLKKLKEEEEANKPLQPTLEIPEIEESPDGDES